MQKEYKTRHNWGGKVIHREWCRKFKFDHTNKWYMHKPESVLENEMRKLHWDFEIQTDHQISGRRPDVVIVNIKKRNCWIVDFVVPVDYWVKIKGSEKCLDLAREQKENCGIWKRRWYQLGLVHLGQSLKDW